MTDAEIICCFDLDYGPEGYPILPPARDMKPKPTTDFDYFVDWCKTDCCITDMRTIRKLWPAHKAMKEARRKERLQQAMKRQAELRAAQQGKRPI